MEHTGGNFIRFIPKEELVMSFPSKFGVDSKFNWGRSMSLNGAGPN